MGAQRSRTGAQCTRTPVLHSYTTRLVALTGGDLELPPGDGAVGDGVVGEVVDGRHGVENELFTL